MKSFSKKLQSYWDNEDRNLYIAEYDVDGTFSLPKGFSIAEFKGLLFCQLVNAGQQERRIVSWWKSKADFEARERDFTKVLGPKSKKYDGTEVDKRLSQSERKWLRPAFIYGVVVTLLAVLGHIEALHGYWNRLFSVPKVVILGKNELLKVMNEPLVVPLYVHNQGERAKVEINEPEIDTSSGLKYVQGSIGLLPTIEPGKREPFELTFHATQPRQFKISIHGRQRAGLFKGWRSLESFEVTAEVWPVIDGSPRKLLLWSGNKAAHIQLNFKNGTHPPKGIRLQLLLQGYEDLQFQEDLFQEYAQDIFIDKTDRTASISGTLVNFEPLKPYHIEFLVVSNGGHIRKDDDWNQVMKSIIILVEEEK